MCKSPPSPGGLGLKPKRSRAYASRMSISVTHDPAAQTFTITGSVWSGTFPISELAYQLRFYRHQQETFPKAMGAYDTTVAGLERLAGELGVGV